MNFMIKKMNVGLFIFLLLSISLSCFALADQTIPEGHDLPFHLSRIESLSKGMELGQFPVRIYPYYFNGYGYANGLMYPDLWLYPAAFLCLLGMNVILSYKVLILVYTAFTAILMYRTLIIITNHEWASRLGMLLYTVSVYRMIDVWTRAALGEVLAFMFIPFIILGIYNIFFDDERRWYDLTIGFSGVFLSHLISALMWTIVMVEICIFTILRLLKHPNRLSSLMKATFMTILLVSYSLFPMIEQLMSQEFRVSDDARYNLTWLLPFNEVFLTQWIQGNPDHWFPGGTGISIIGIVLLGFLALNQKDNKDKRLLGWIGIMMSCIFLIMMCDFFPWPTLLKVAPFLGRLQFAWRFLMIATTFLVLSFSLFYSISNRLGKGLGFLIVIWSVLLGVRVEFETSVYYESINPDVLRRIVMDDNAVTDREYTVGNGEYLPLRTDMRTMYESENHYSFNQDVDYKAIQSGTTIKVDFSGQKEPNLEMEVPLLYYKGYVATLDGQLLEVESGDNGVVKVIVPDLVGQGQVEIFYEGTMLQHLTLGVSFVSLIIFTFFIIHFKFNNKSPG